MKRHALLFVVLYLFFSRDGRGQATPSTLAIVASKTTFVFGEPFKLTAHVRDASNIEIPKAAVTWSVDPPTAATVASDGTVTALDLQSIVVRAFSGAAQGEIALQILPKRIVVTPQRDTMTVGTTQLIRAEAMDFNDQPIPRVAIRWSLSNLLRGWDNNNPMATIDLFGQMQALVQGTVLIAATVNYQYFPGFLYQARGEATVDMRAIKTYEFSRVLAAQPKTGPSSLMPRTVHLMPSEDDGFTFAASLDSTGLSLIQWENGDVQSLLSSGRGHVQTGQPLTDILAYATNHNGEMLTEEVDTTGSTQISSGASAAQVPLLVPGTPLYVADRTTRFDIQRNSLADSGMKLLQVSYNEVDTLRPGNALFRGQVNGLSEKIVSTLDSLPGYPNQPFSFRYYGIANDGTAWFSTSIGTPQAKLVLWKQKPFDVLERVLGDSDAFQGSTIRNVANSGTATGPSLFVASNGEVVTAADTLNATYVVRWQPDDSTPQVLRGGSIIYWHEPGVGTLVNTNQNNRGNGLYLWSSSGDVRPLLLIGASIDGSPVVDIQSAVSNSHGVIFAMVSTVANPMSIVRVAPDLQVVLRSGDSLNVAVPPIISSLVRGRRQGMPVAIVGGQTGTIAQVDASGNLQPIISVGSPLPGGKTFRGSNATQVRTLANGDIVFADGNGLFRWSNGTITLLVANPTSVAGMSIGSPSAIDVNGNNDIVLQVFSGSATGVYLVAGTTVSKIVRIDDLVNGEPVTTVRQPAIDDSGRVFVYVVTARNEYLTIWKGGAATVLLSDGSTLPDGRAVKTHDTVLQATSDSVIARVFLTDGQSTYIRYRTNAWEFVAGRNERMPNGSYLLYTNTYAVSQTGDVAFFYNGGAYINHLVAKRVNKFLQIQDWGELTDDDDLLVSLTSLMINDDGSIFALATNDSAQQVLYRGALITGAIEAPFSLHSFGGFATTTNGSASSPSVGYARMEAGSTVSGLAIFGNRQNGVLVSEAAVPASRSLQNGRIFAEVAGPINTGVAIANPNNQPAKVSYFLTRADGTVLSTGSFTLDPNKQTASFLNQPPFNSGANFTGTLSFSASLPVSVIALRGNSNLRGEFLITTLPVTDLDPQPAQSVATLPHFASGGGWTSQIILVNPIDAPVTGNIEFYSSGSDSTSGSPLSVTAGGQTSNRFAYTISAKGSFKLTTAGTESVTSRGSVRIVPGVGQVTPASLVVFSFTSNNTVVSEAAITPLAGVSMQMYAEASGDPFGVGSIQTGLAIANASSQAVSVTIDLRRLDGTASGVRSLIVSVPANGQLVNFIGELFPALPRPFQGVIRVTAGSSISVAGLRGRTNERGDFLITTTPPALTGAGVQASDLFFPHLVDGGGYTTQIIIIGNGVNDSTGVLQFIGQSGQPLPLNFR